MKRKWPRANLVIFAISSWPFGPALIAIISEISRMVIHSSCKNLKGVSKLVCPSEAPENSQFWKLIYSFFGEFLGHKWSLAGPILNFLYWGDRTGYQKKHIKKIIKKNQYLPPFLIWMLFRGFLGHKWSLAGPIPIFLYWGDRTGYHKKHIKKL